MDLEKEKSIGARLRAFREALQIPRSRFAVAAGFGSERIASYESGRAALPYEVFKAINRRYHISPLWLGLGRGSAKWHGVFDDSNVAQRIKPRALFSEVFEKYLALDLIAAEGSAVRAIQTLRSELAKAKTLVAEGSIPVAELRKLADEVSPVIDELGKLIQRERKLRKPFEKQFSPKDDLTNSATSDSTTSMQGKWPALKKQLQSATEKTGKSALAKFLKVDLTRVSQWLTDAKSQREPGAEYALQMQEWLRRQQT